MSINYKKINELIREEISTVKHFDEDQRKKLSSLCEKIYQIESSIEFISSSRRIDDIMGAIEHTANFLKKGGTKE